MAVMLMNLCRICIEVVFCLQNADGAAVEERLPRVPPREPADAVSTFECATGFEMTLLAAEPLV